MIVRFFLLDFNKSLTRVCTCQTYSFKLNYKYRKWKFSGQRENAAKHTNTHTIRLSLFFSELSCFLFRTLLSFRYSNLSATRQAKFKFINICKFLTYLICLQNEIKRQRWFVNEKIEQNEITQITMKFLKKKNK